MLTKDEEQRIRDTVRRSLDNILGSKADEDGGGVDAPSELDKLTEAERIIAEETERYYQARGLVRHQSRSGRVHWVTPDEEEKLRERDGRRRHRTRRPLRVRPRVALVWAVTILLAALLIAYLVHTQTLDFLDSGNEIADL